jgi:GA-binding protein transcription factor alpha
MFYLPICHSFQWATRKFGLSGINLNDWNINGQTLAEMDLKEFQKRVPTDPNDLFWTHLELLRKCKFVAVLQKDVNEPIEDGESEMKKAARGNVTCKS